MLLQRPKAYLDAPPEAPVPVLPPTPVLPAPELPVPEPLPIVPLLGDDAEPPAELEPEALPCSRRQRSFAAPVMESHWVLLLPIEEFDEALPLTLGEVVEGSDEELEEPALPLADDPVLPDPPTLCDDDWAIAPAEKANSAATAAAEIVFNIGVLLCEVRDKPAPVADASRVPPAGYH